jgi:hypothetical protein
MYRYIHTYTHTHIYIYIDGYKFAKVHTEAPVCAFWMVRTHCADTVSHSLILPSLAHEAKRLPWGDQRTCGMESGATDAHTQKLSLSDRARPNQMKREWMRRQELRV